MYLIQLDGHPLPISRRVFRHSNGTLQLVDVHTDDQGWYRCEVSNGQQTAQGSLYVHILGNNYIIIHIILDRMRKIIFISSNNIMTPCCCR